MTGNTKPRQHFIPKFYLEGFCDVDGYVWKYTKKSPLEKPIRIMPINVAVIRGLYSLNDVPMGCIDEFERYIGLEIEAPSAEILRTIRNLEQLPKICDRRILVKLIALQYIRTPGYIKNFSGVVSNKEITLDNFKDFLNLAKRMKYCFSC